MSRGSCCPSSSSVATQSADVLAIPARVAGCWPKLRDSQRTRTNGLFRASDCITDAEPSTAPSCTKRISLTRRRCPAGVECGADRASSSANRASSVRSPR